MYRAVGLFFICHCKIKAHQFESSDVPSGKTFQKKKANLQVLNVAVQVWFIFWDLKIVSKSQEFQKHLKIMSEDIQIFVSRVSSSPKKSQISMWKTTYTSQGSEGTNWPCCLWPASPASPPPRCPWAQEPHCSSDLGQDAMKRERAMKCSSAKPWQVPTRLLTALLSCTLAQSSPKLDCRYFCVWPCTQLNSTSTILWTLDWPHLYQWPSLLAWLGDRTAAPCPLLLHSGISRATAWPVVLQQWDPAAGSKVAQQ